MQWILKEDFDKKYARNLNVLSNSHLKIEAIKLCTFILAVVKVIALAVVDQGPLND